MAVVPGKFKDVPRQDWYWCGFAAHFIAIKHCHYWLHTRVGNVIISTIGEYRPDGPSTKAQPFSHGRKFETLVFLAKDSDRPEGNIADYTQIASEYTNTSEESERLHYTLCSKWSYADKQEYADGIRKLRIQKAKEDSL